MFKRITIIISGLLAICLLCYINATKINTNQLQIRQEILQSSKIDEDTDGLLIAYFSDLYYGTYLDTKYLDKVFNAIDSFKPDLIIFGGDLIDDKAYSKLSQEEKDYLPNKLNLLSAKYGKYAILGEYDYKQYDLIRSIYGQSGFNILENVNQQINIDKNSYFNIIGISSLIDGSPDISLAFSGVNLDNYSIVLSHCPDIFDELTSYNFDYLLSGHSRGGQINLPIINLFNRPSGAEKFLSGKITKNGKTLDISNGIGRLSTNARLNADAEVVFYTLKQIKSSSTSE